MKALHHSAAARPVTHPFASHWLDLDAGRMHFLDEGPREPEGAVVMVHGTPSSSFLYRHLIRCLLPETRSVAPDHLGFGLSDKPPDYRHRPADHSRNLEILVDSLGLRDITLVVHDFGGPIGLGYAIRRPDNVRRIVLFNTWLWSVAGERRYRLGERFFAGPVGRLAYLRMNLSPRLLVPLAFSDRTKLDPAVHERYVAPFAHPKDRMGPWRFAVEFTRSGPWLDRLWERRGLLTQKPTLLLWGMRDRFMPAQFLERWQRALPGARVVRFSEAGHFVQEEAPEQVCFEVRRFLGDGSSV
jgi:pimeloyl-ACP methyl ester carboxylesterase